MEPTMAEYLGIDPARRNVQPQPLTPEESEKMKEFLDHIQYSARYASLRVILHTCARNTTPKTHNST
jgi:hypothetical protein